MTDPREFDPDSANSRDPRELDPDYDKHGGFMPTVVVTIVVYVLILPVILLVPRRLTATKDGEPLAVLGAE